ncbi:hypothetical protein BpHYR1_051315 [Brachionus plicatilis]|uniref:Uncharacterized protein n=1 Tax=Brachionus plicatilis TaxID=10195 RepID=A0A3M7PCL9_BRAPC|nr:hypothetical protein BpHYR1_051315 [Brachionus plicatilis]
MEYNILRYKKFIYLNTIYFDKYRINFFPDDKITKTKKENISSHFAYKIKFSYLLNRFFKEKLIIADLFKNLVNRSENKGPVGALRGNSIRVQGESFPAQFRNDFAAAVIARHVFSQTGKFRIGIS